MTNRILLVLSLTLALAGCGSSSHEHGDESHQHAGGEDAHHHHDGEHHHHEDGDAEHHHDEGHHGEGHHGEGHHGEGHHEHGEMHPALRAYHDVLAPAWHADEGDARVAASCEASPALIERGGPLGEAMTAHQTEAGADNPAAAAEALTASANGLAEQCNAEPRDGAAVEAAIAEVHDRFHTIMEALRGE